jgi:predicted peroxiredoxin
LTALSFGYECEIFLSDDGVKLILPEYIAGLKAGSFDPLAELLDYCTNMGGRIYACNPAMNSRNIDVDKNTSGITGFVNASKLVESSIEADAVFTY